MSNADVEQASISSELSQRKRLSGASSSVEERGLLGEDDKINKSIPHRSLFHLIAINSFAFTYGICISTFGLIILPLESEALWPNAQEALLLSIFLAICGLSQLSGPLAGYASDLCTGSWGRRRPYLLGGALVTIPSLLVLHYASQTRNFGLYLSFFFCAMLGLNVMYTSYSGALTDLVHDDQRGLANGMMGAFSVLGASFGFGCFSSFLTLNEAYFFYCICIAVAVVISLFAYTEEPFVPSGEMLETAWSWSEIAKCYWIDRIEHYDFYLVFVSRTLYYMGISAQTFMMFYFRDLIVDSDDPQADVSYLALIGQLSGAIVCIPMGILSNKLGRKPLIYLSSFVIVGAYTGFSITRHRDWAWVVGAIYGIGNGAYLSVDYALACDVLPDKNQAARYLGIWSVGSFIGTLFGPLLIGPALVIFGTPSTQPVSDKVTYEPLGYIVMIVIGSICITLGAIVV
eukprot:CAMPEP_0194252492 /NCGR_PEP_ID=MMETSP0158-20130606/27759_1 /TAXON_ID=33649 /ORGANISM="Thalassionema nitzschioides, Strain L26-B" /LENGTH=458 /DNA_ID=CAMNT_0038989921 /DNA_START=29 /DNA_END=1402 /DNA_ORIENTATION=-